MSEAGLIVFEDAAAKLVAERGWALDLTAAAQTLPEVTVESGAADMKPIVPTAVQLSLLGAASVEECFAVARQARQGWRESQGW